MTNPLKSVTQTVKALPVMQERAKMPPHRVRSQIRSVLLALVCFAIGGCLFAFTEAPWYVGTAFMGLGVFALDARLVKDGVALVGQLLSRSTS